MPKPRKKVTLSGKTWTVFKLSETQFLLVPGTFPADKDPRWADGVPFALYQDRVCLTGKSSGSDIQREILVRHLKAISEGVFVRSEDGHLRSRNLVLKAWREAMTGLASQLQAKFDEHRPPKAAKNGSRNSRKSRQKRTTAVSNPGRHPVFDAVPPEIRRLAERISSGGRAHVNLVGGAVIDLLEGREVKDWDLEVFGLSWDRLVGIARTQGKTSEVGKSFGIVKVTLPSGLEVDLSVPRRDSKAGTGHKGIHVDVDPNMSVKEAARRRDFTINSMALDLNTGELHDPFGGLADLQAGVLRVTDEERFRDDPLRGLRGMQLLARKARTVDPDSMRIIRSMRHEHDELPRERLLEEWRKLMLKAKKPSVGLQYLQDTGWIENYPELAALEGVVQSPAWHPEGDVWTHTKQAADAAAMVRHLVPDEQREAFMFGTTFHDIGKPYTTVTQEMVDAGEYPPERLYTAYGHDVGGIPHMQRFTERLGFPNKTRDLAVGLVGLHMQPSYLHSGKAKKAAYIDLARKMEAVGGDLHLLARVCQCDACAVGSGRGFTASGEPDWEHHISQTLLSRMEEVGNVPPPPLVQGRDLIAMGLKPGTTFGSILKRARDLQDEGFTREEILAAIRSSLGE